jgi:hypothetical protein
MLIETVNPAQVVLQVQAQNLDGTPKTVLTSATVRVYHLSGGSEVVDLAITSLVQVPGTSTWRHIWEPTFLTAGHYFAEYALTDFDSAVFIGTEDLDIRDIARQADLSFVKKIEKGRWRIVGQHMIFYDEDNVTPLLTFDLKDINGLPSNVNIFERVPH